MFHITAIGELLIDFTPISKSEKGYPVFEQNPGGAPANLLVSASKLGLKTAFIGKVGEDNFGYFLKNVLDDFNVDTSGLVIDERFETTLAFVHLDEENNRSFTFYRSKGADKFLEDKEVNKKLIDESKVFHFGTVSLTEEPCRSTVLNMVNYAIDNDKIISLDVNWRKFLWKDFDDAINIIKKSVSLAHIVKLSEEELQLITGVENIEEAIQKLLSEYSNIDILAVTLGENGCFVSNNVETKYIPGNLKINGKPLKVVDTTGAGDCFMGAFISYLINEYDLSKKELSEISIETLEKASKFANKAASICVTKKGGIPSMPSLSEIESIN